VSVPPELVGADFPQPADMELIADTISDVRDVLCQREVEDVVLWALETQDELTTPTMCGRLYALARARRHPAGGHTARPPWPIARDPSSWPGSDRRLGS
jgi:hypothetical protein